MTKSIEVPVRGGALTLGEFGDPNGTVIFGIHGITSSHRAFAALAHALPNHRILAPDLRGRGRSASLPGPWRVETHVTDCVAALDALEIDSAIVVGHSMGALVSVVLAAKNPKRIRKLVLVDGGLPLALPPGLDEAAAIAAQLGPSVARLSMTFESRETYRAFWHAHPAFAKLPKDDPADLDGYADYDLVSDEAGILRPATNAAAVAADSSDLFGPPVIRDALTKLPETTMLVAPTWLAEDSPPLFSAETLADWHRRLPQLRV